MPEKLGHQGSPLNSWTTILCLLLFVLSCRAEAKDPQGFRTRMGEVSNKLLLAARNLQQMSSALSIDEREHIQAFGAAAMDLSDYATELETVGYIHFHMDDEKDKAFVSKVFSERCRDNAELAQAQIKAMNLELTDLKTTAVLQEATKARDIAIQLEDLMRRCGK